MDIREIHALHRAEPFEAFNLILRDGRKLPVNFPHYLAISTDGELLVHASLQGGFESFSPSAVKSVDFHATLARSESERMLAFAKQRSVDGTRDSWNEMQPVLAALLRRRPFEPFLIYLADGRTVSIQAAEQTTYGMSPQTILIVQTDRRIEIVNTSYVVSVQSERPSQPPTIDE